MSTPSGFDRAPVSRTLLGVSVISSLVGVFVTSYSTLAPSAASFAATPATFTHAQVGRLISAPLCFVTTSEAVLGWILIYHMRLFERHFGSNKYAASVIFFVIINLLLQLALSFATSKSSAFPVFAPGFYSFIFALFPTFYLDIPALTRVQIKFLPLSDKSLLYLLGIQMFFASFPSSCLSATLALFTGIIYRLPCLRLPDLIRLPSCCVAGAEWCGDATSRCVGSIMGAVVTAGGGNSNNNRGGQNGRRFGGGGSSGYRLGSSRAAASGGYERVIDDDGSSFGTPLVHDDHHRSASSELTSSIPAGVPTALIPSETHTPAPAANAEVDPAALRTLVSMGFDAGRARDALARTNNNVDAATNLLVQ